MDPDAVIATVVSGMLLWIMAMASFALLIH